MAQIINEQGFGSRLGEALGTGLGSGLSQGIHSILNQKMHGLQQRSRYSDLKRSGMTDQAAGFLSMFDPEQQIKLLQGQDISSLFEPMEQAQAQPQFAQALQQESVQQQHPELAALQQLNEPYQQQNPAQLVQRAMAGQQGKLNPQEALRSFAEQQLQPNKVPNATDQLLKTNKPASKSPLGKSFKQLALERKEAQEAAKEQRIERHFKEKQTAAEQKKNKAEFGKILEDLSSANDEDRDIAQLERYIKSGNLPDPTFHSFLNTIEKGIWGFGINLKNLEHADAQAYDKTLKRFLRGVKAQLGGGNLSDSDIRLFMDQYPDLSKSDEGKWKIIQSMKALNEMKRVTAATAENIVKANGGVVPDNIKHLAESKAKSQLDKLRDQFIEGTYGQPFQERSELQNLAEVLSGKRGIFGGL